MNGRLIAVIGLTLSLSLIASAGASNAPKVVLAATYARNEGTSERVACTEARVQTVVAEFIDAFNVGDARRLDRVFAPPGDFLWYTVDGYGYTDRTTLVDYLEHAHRDGEQLQLRRLRYNGMSSTGHGGFESSLIRRTTDQGSLLYDGKGACTCYADGGNVIAMWGMGREDTTMGKPAVVALTGSVGPGRTISLKRAGGAGVTSLAAGRFRITVRDRSRADNFHLSGPGLNKKTGVGFRGTVRWTVELSAGRYVYKSDQHKALRRTFSVET
jgi:hypothetical protein